LSRRLYMPAAMRQNDTVSLLRAALKRTQHAVRLTADRFFCP
jgi:hypothetical protein